MYIKNNRLFCNIALAMIFAVVACIVVVSGKPDGFFKANDMRPSEEIDGTISLETYAVVFSAKNHVLRVPRNYLETVSASGDGIFFRIVMTYPEFSGVDGNSEKMFALLTSRAAWWNHSPSNVIWAYGVGHMSSTKKQWNEPILAAAKTQRDMKTEYGLKKVYGQSIVGDDYYVFVGNNAEDDVVIKCDPTMDGICQVDFDLAMGLVVEYAYNRTQLSHWREINGGVRRVLRTFLER